MHTPFIIIIIVVVVIIVVVIVLHFSLSLHAIMENAFGGFLNKIKFRSDTHGLNEELGRHRGGKGKTECSLCGDECENVSHVLWECSA